MSRGLNYFEMNSGWLRSMKRAERDEKKARAARLARRDLEYAAAHVRVVVDCVKTTDGRTLVVETRGQRCVASRF